MDFTKEQLEQVKQQLIQQINSTFPEDKKNSAIEQIEEMNSEQLIKFLKQNNLIKEGTEKQKCIFCSIILEEITSFKIEDFKEAIAVLEINPISKGHILVIPKTHSNNKQEIEEKTKRLVNKIKKKINLRLRPKEILVAYSEMFGHGIINIIPVYKNETINSPRKQANKQELEELFKILKRKIRTTKKTSKKKTKKKKVIKEKTQEIKLDNKIKTLSWFPKRIP